MARKILFPTDGSPAAKAAGRFARDIAKGEGDSLLVLVVAAPAAYGSVEDKAVTEGIASYMRQVAEDEATELSASGVEASFEVVESLEIHEAIVAKAQEAEADMMVMGTHGHTGFRRAVIGSIADKVVRYSDVPVVLVPLKSGE